MSTSSYEPKHVSQEEIGHLAGRAHSFDDTLLKALGHTVLEASGIPVRAAEGRDLGERPLLQTQRWVGCEWLF